MVFGYVVELTGNWKLQTKVHFFKTNDSISFIKVPATSEPTRNTHRAHRESVMCVLPHIVSGTRASNPIIRMKANDSFAPFAASKRAENDDSILKNMEPLSGILQK